MGLLAKLKGKTWSSFAFISLKNKLVEYIS